MKDFFASSVGVLFVAAYIGSLPLAIIFGDKGDVALSLIIPTYGFWVMLGAFF
jgi:hypothetical protein